MSEEWRGPHGESGKSFRRRLIEGFIARWCTAACVLDVGCGDPKHRLLPYAIGVDLGYPNYDGRTLPWPDESVDTVYSSHCLEHVIDPLHIIRDWYRVLRVGGFIVTIVPHQHLYEKKPMLPSRWNGDHKRFYTPASLLAQFEVALAINSYRVRHLADNDTDFDYAIGPDRHSVGCYEIELVIEKRRPPAWGLR